MISHERELRLSMPRFGFQPESFALLRELPSNPWHGDVHYKISAGGMAFSARLFGTRRYAQEAPFIERSDEVLIEQLRYARFLDDAGIPYMRHRPAVTGEPFIRIGEDETAYRLVLFEWMDGEHRPAVRLSGAEEMGRLARRMHELSRQFHTRVFPAEPHLTGYARLVRRLREQLDESGSSARARQALASCLADAEAHIAQGGTEQWSFLVQTDLNPLNILWQPGGGSIVGVVDCESITLTDRTEGLAWLLKWYSRIGGAGSPALSSELAAALLSGYRADEVLTPRDFGRLPSLLWLSGCMNWNFAARTLELLNQGEDLELLAHLSAYRQRGERLLSLL